MSERFETEDEQCERELGEVERYEALLLARDFDGFSQGDLVRVRKDGKLLPGVWVFRSVVTDAADGHRRTNVTVTVRRVGKSTPRYFDATRVELTLLRGAVA